CRRSPRATRRYCSPREAERRRRGPAPGFAPVACPWFTSIQRQRVYVELTGIILHPLRSRTNRRESAYHVPSGRRDVPELPEIETIRRGLGPLVVGRRVIGVEVRERRLREPIAPRGLARLRGATLTGIRRRSKYLLLAYDAGL